MLNGRVYGAPNKNPFANVRDTEPEFVEWGYGGMGSQKSKSGAPGSDWSRVQGSSSVFRAADDDASSEKENQRDREQAFAAAAASTDGDDGSGMGWVKKRREQKEQKEREAREAQEAAAAAESKEDDKPKEGVGVEVTIFLMVKRYSLTHHFPDFGASGGDSRIC